MNFRTHRKITGILVGLAIGLFIGFALSTFTGMSLRLDCNPIFNKQLVFGESTKQGFLFVGVMTSKGFIGSRAAAVYKSWARSINGRVVFFSSENTPSRSDIPVVSLQNVDDVYPPQKKAFYLLKYMAEHVIDNYEFFMRVDDDSFIRGDLLEKLLRSVNSSKPWMIGQPGTGNQQEHGLLGLEHTWNYCQGGPGVVFTRETLVRIAPHIQYCVDNIYSSHEDVELGRCVNRFAGIPCTWSYEMKDIFFQNYKEYKGSFINTLQDPEVQRAITLHPIKIPEHQFRINNHFTSKQITELRQKKQQLQNEISEITKILDKKSISKVSAQTEKLPLNILHADKLPLNDGEVWEFFTPKSLASQINTNPTKSLGNTGYNKTVHDLFAYAVKLSKPKRTKAGWKLISTKLINGYVKRYPHSGAYFILTMEQIFRIPKQNGKIIWTSMKINSYFNQAFLETEFVEDISTDIDLDTEKKSDQEFKSDSLFRSKRTLNSGEPISQKFQTIHFIVPLAGRLSTFRRFMVMFENVCLSKNENVVLHIVWFRDASPTEEQENIKKIVLNCQKSYGIHFIDLVSLNQSIFSRATALSIGANRTSSGDLLFFVDADLMFTSELLKRIRLNTIRSVQIYYPIMFNQYDPQYVCGNTPIRFCKTDHFDFNFRKGFWRDFSTGMVSMYRDDLDKVGGFNTSYIGWGGEDTRLYEQVVDSNITVFRAADPGLFHIYHSKECDTNLDQERFKNCIRSKATLVASKRQLAEITIQLPHILNRN